MEFTINILDSFPSLNKLTQKHNILLELNNKEYNLKKLILQQDTISIKENISKLLFKVHAILNNKKILIGVNHLNAETFNFDNKFYITWIEFKKKVEENKKEINDINLLFYDCIRLKIKITPNKTIPKSDKKVKTNKSKIKFQSPGPQRKNTGKQNNNDSNNINIINSCRIVNQKNYLLKSNSNLLNDNKNINNGANDENNMINNNNENKGKVLINEKMINGILDDYQNAEIDPQKSISQEYMKDLMIENDCLLTDNNILENYSHSTSLGDNLNKKINSTNFKKVDNNKAELKDNNINSINVTEIKNNNKINHDALLQNSLICPNNFNKIIKNILKNSYEENKKNNNRDNSLNKNMEIIKENENVNVNNSNTIRKIKARHKKNKSFNKINYNNNIMPKKEKYNSKTKVNLKNKNNINNDNSISKENILHDCYTLNDFYKNKLLSNPNFEKLELDKNNKDISLKDINISNIDKNTNLNDLLISKKNEDNNKKDIIQETENEKDISKDYNNEYEKIKNNEFSTLKKDYDLFYTTKFIKSIKNDLLELEFNLAIEKSISLFLLYNKESYILFKKKKELMNVITNHIHKTEEIHKKMNLLNYKKIKNELKEKNKVVIKESYFNYNNKFLFQKEIFENLIKTKKNKKEKLKAIISLIIKSKPSLLNLFNNKNNKKQKEEKDNNNNIKLVSKSPLKSSNKSQYNSPKLEDIILKKKMTNDGLLGSKNKNLNKKSSKFVKANSKNLIYKKNKSVKNKFDVNIINKNMQKNNSINNLLNFENTNDKNAINAGNIYNKDNKNENMNNIHLIQKNNENGKNNNLIYYSTARTKFYNINSTKLK